MKTKHNATDCILVADSGSTKTDWCLANGDGTCHELSTSGLNPFFLNENEMVQVMRVARQLIDTCPTAIYFYGAGCTPEKSGIVAGALQKTFAQAARIEVESDMLGAARSLCRHEAGIVCILGTGSNSCFYDGHSITANVPPLGFILGDEGSGAVLGKLLVGSILKNLLPAGLKEAFLKRFDTSQEEIIDHVYRQPFPNRYLAGFNVFLEEHLEVPEVRALVLHSFEDFLTRNVQQYDYKHYPVHFVGSIAYCYREVLAQAAQNTGCTLGHIEKKPVKGLIHYHLNP